MRAGVSTSLFFLTLALTLTLKSFQHDQRLAGSLFEKGDGIEDRFCNVNLINMIHPLWMDPQLGLFPILLHDLGDEIFRYLNVNTCLRC